MLQFVIRKMLNKKWMVLSLLIGNILLAAIAASNPMYTETVLQRTLDSAFSNYIEENNVHPVMIRAEKQFTDDILPQIDKITADFEQSSADFGMPLQDIIMYYETTIVRSGTNLDRADRTNNYNLCTMSNLEDHITLIGGTGMSESFDEDDVVDAIVSEACMRERSLLLGEILTFEKFGEDEEHPMKVRIAGVFAMSDESDSFWVRSPSAYKYALFLNQDFYLENIAVEGKRSRVTVTWNAQYDYSNLHVEDVAGLVAASDEFAYNLNKKYDIDPFVRFKSTLSEFQRSEKQVRTTFLVLQVPVLFLLAVFIFMVSRQMLGMEEGEIAVIKSRGASRSQILGIYIVQSFVLALLTLVTAIPLSLILVRLLASACGFLEFVRRKNLLVTLSKEALLYSAGAVLVSILVMTVPVFQYASTSIVNQKQKKSRKAADIPFWHRYFIDVILLGISGYGLYSFNSRKAFLAEQVLAGESLDPLLFVSASVFMLGAGLLALRILPLLIKIIFNLFKKWWSPAMYTSFVRIMRTRKQQSLIMIFLVMTMAIGVFNATAARTFNNNDELNVRYNNGADIVLQEVWQDNSREVALDDSLDLVYKEPDYSRYEILTEVESTTKVLMNGNGILAVNNGKISDINIMGIETKKFGETAYFDSSLLSTHWYNYLNVLSSASNGVILSSNFKEYGLKIGDRITYRATDRPRMIIGVIYGFVDYWPGYQPTVYEKGTDGTMVDTEQFLIIANLSHLEQTWGVTPYQVWMKTSGSSEFIYEFAEKNNIEFELFKDTAADLNTHNNSAVMQGTNGILTIGFIVSLVLCIVGFLIYWVLSVRSREMQFGIFRAMGMSMREIVTILLSEQVFISGGAIAAGVLTGILTSRLFIPLIQIAYSKSDYSIPLVIVTDSTDMIRIAIIVGSLIILCMLLLGSMVRRIQIAQALKLGEE